MTIKPNISKAPNIPSMRVQSYERYLPSAFDDSLSMLEKLNKMIHQLNLIGDISNDIVRQWNETMEWIMSNGLSDVVSQEVDKRIKDGTFNELITNIVGDLEKLETADRSDMVNALNEINKIVVENDKEIGDVSTLNTDNKDSLVEALNEMLMQVLINKSAPISLAEGTGHGVISGLEVRQQKVLAMAVDVGNLVDPNIVHMDNGVRYTPDSIALAVLPSHPSLDRLDIVYVNKEGEISYLSGVPSLSPVLPALPEGGEILAEISVKATDTTINDIDITDRRNVKAIAGLKTNNKNNFIVAINEIVDRIKDVSNEFDIELGEVVSSLETEISDAINGVLTQLGEDRETLTIAINDVLSKLGEDKETLSDAINDVSNDLGDKNGLLTTDKTSIVNAINEVIDSINDIVGLNIDKVIKDVGDKSTLTTLDKTTVVGAINEIDSRVKDLAINVKSFGAKGDGVTDDTQSIQNAITFLYANGGGKLLFPPATYIVTMVHIYEGIVYEGYGATLKRPPNQPKWTRTFTSANPQDGYDGYKSGVNSKPLVVKGFTFDGNRTQQGAYQSYELEQAHCLFLSAHPDSKGKLVAFVEDCVFTECVGDGLSIYTNVHAMVSNCKAWNTWRGGFVLTGGGSDVHVSNFNVDGDVHHGGIDIEVDGDTIDDGFKINLFMENVYVKGDFDCTIPEKSSGVLNNVISDNSPFNVGAGEHAELIISNSVFTVGQESDTLNRLVVSGDITFNNCVFNPAQSALDVVIQNIYWYSPELPSSVRYNNCVFKSPKVTTGIGKITAVRSQPNGASMGKVIGLNNCTVEKGYDIGYQQVQGGILHIDGGFTSAKEPLRVAFAGAYYYKNRVKNLSFVDTEKFMHVSFGSPENELKFDNIHITSQQNVIDVVNNMENSYTGSRTIVGDLPPTPSTHSLTGDVYRLKKPVAGQAYEWIATNTSHVDSIWKVSKTLGE